MSNARKKWIIAMLLSCVFALMLPLFTAHTVLAAESQQPETMTEDEIETRLFTNLSLTLKGGGGFVSAIAKNEFTLFPSTVYVIVELYCSETEPSGYEEMTLIAKVSQVDLNMGNTTEARAGTGGVQKYWMGRMRYKIDGNNWDERVTPIGLFSAEGESITIV